MSRSDPQLLRAEIDLLRREIQLLTLRLDNLEERSEIASIEASERSLGREEFHHPSPSCDSRRSLDRSFQSQASSNRSAVEVLSTDRAGREELARTIGHFIRRSLDGQPRGPSGRDRLNLQNRYYLVFADFEGNHLETPRFSSRFSEVKELVKRGNSAGSSVFVGLPTLWESRIVVQTAGFDLPPGLTNA